MPCHFFFLFILVSFGAACSRVAQVAFEATCCISAQVAFLCTQGQGFFASTGAQVASHSSSAVTNKQHTHTRKHGIVFHPSIHWIGPDCVTGIWNSIFICNQLLGSFCSSIWRSAWLPLLCAEKSRQKWHHLSHSMIGPGHPIHLSQR